MASTYEVTVPVTVTIETDTHGLVVTKVEFDSWGGYFSEAEDAAGVWDATAEKWGDDDQEAIYEIARRFVRRQIVDSADAAS